MVVPIENIVDEFTLNAGINLSIKREDLIHPWVSGNKWRKLKYNIIEARESKTKKLITFGGAYSNHILAVAAAAYEYNLKSVGIIRGEETLPLNPTLNQAKNEFGMKIFYVSRSEFRITDKRQLIKDLGLESDDHYILPEGGTNYLAIKGCTEIIDDLRDDYDYICCSCGTGGTLTGIICASSRSSKIIGFPALKGDFLQKEISDFILSYQDQSKYNWTLINDYHFGGYAKHNAELIDFINGFFTKHKIPLDPIYTGKMIYGIYDLMARSYFEKGAKILAIHTGGIQGIRGFNQRHGSLLLT